MTSDSFSVTKPLPELKGFAQIANTLSSSARMLGGWKPGSGTAAVPAGLGVVAPRLHPSRRMRQAPETDAGQGQGGSKDPS